MNDWEEIADFIKETFLDKRTTLERPCKACGGSGVAPSIVVWGPDHDCPTCHGSKTEQITIGDMIARWKEGR